MGSTSHRTRSVAAKHPRLIVLILLGCVVACVGLLREGRPTRARTQLNAPAGIESRDPVYGGSEQAPSLGAPSTRSLHGLVRARGGGPLAAVTLCLLDASGDVKVSTACVESDAAGKFGFSEAQSDARGVLASLPGYLPRRTTLDATSSSRALLIELDAGGESLLGRVVDASGGFVAAAVVTLRANTGATIAVTSSLVDGKFQLASSPGGVEICAQAEAYSRTCSALGAPTEEYVLVLALESKIVGRVRRRADGSNIAGATVTASNRDGLRVPPRSTTSDEDGNFSIDALPAGGYDVVAVSGNARSTEQWVTVGLGDTSGEVTLWAESAVRFTGQILASGEPCSRGSLELSGPISARGPLSEDGKAELDGIVPGHYEATAECEGAIGHTAGLDVEAKPVERTFNLEKLDDSSSANADKPKASGGTIRATLEGEPAAASAVFAVSADGVPQRGRRRGAEFLFERLLPGEYRVYLNDYVEQAESARIASEGDLVNVGLRAPKTARISGRVTSDDGAPVADAWVSVSRSDLMAIAVATPPTLTAADGAFNLPAVPGATYTVTVSSPLGNAELHAVKANEEVQVRVRAPASLSGQVQTAQGGPVPDFTISYRGDHDPSGFERRGGNSAFNLPMLDPDTYTLQVTSALGSTVERVRVGPREAATIKLTLSEPAHSPTD